MHHIPPKKTLRIALVGDYSHDIVAHQAIPLAIDDAAAVLEITADYDWLPTSEINSAEDLVGYDAIWVVPGSPYKNARGAFIAIQYARENAVPFLGTCGGFQHAVIEYARNVLGWSDAAHAETENEGRMVISPLICALVDQTGTIELRPNTLIARAYGREMVEEAYRCSFGVSAEFARELESGDLVFFRTQGRGTADHVGVYVGNGKFIQSPRSGQDIQVTSLSEDYWQRHYVGARRVVTPKTIR